MLAIPACCVLATTCFYPQVPLKVPTLMTAFPATAATASGIAAGLRHLGKKKEITVVGLAGDGGTADIGIQALSGALDRGDQILYICYDNEAYMNTGVQRSGATPKGARTTTTPGGQRGMWESSPKKDLLSIVAAHGIPYAATSCISFPQDFMQKLAKAAQVEDGPSFIHVLAPCPPGWGYASEKTIELGKLAVEAGVFILREWENGEMKVTRKLRKRKPLAEYLKPQARFRHLTDEEIKAMEEEIARAWETIS
ncbi:MAG: pyruvate synthase subunit beta [Firmicutes bacterium]|nr:pyruvate synthase subunit beta [Bacillota bacterium]